MTPSGHTATVTLPGGYVDQQGVSHREVELSMLTGEDEYAVATADPREPAARLVTQLLSRCVRRVGSVAEVTPGLLSDLLVGDRDYLLLRLRELTFGGRVDCVMTCPRPDCAEKMDISFDLRQLDFESKPVARRYFALRLDGAVEEIETDDEEGRSGDGEVRTHDLEVVAGAGKLIEFRLPTGGDQEALSDLFALDPEAAAGELFVRCVRGAGGDDEAARAVALPTEARAALDEAMRQLSPEVLIEIEAACPACGEWIETSFDFATHFLSELLLDARSVEREVHFLAWHYHWSERDILSMTRARRRRYVALLQGEVDRLNQVW